MPNNADSNELLKRIKDGEVSFGPEYEAELDDLAADGEITIIQKHRESMSGNNSIDRILVRLNS